MFISVCLSGITTSYTYYRRPSDPQWTWSESSWMSMCRTSTHPSQRGYGLTVYVAKQLQPHLLQPYLSSANKHACVYRVQPFAHNARV